ncbi:entericidin A/B family lipoprotein [Paracoccus onubensis]|uniref:entericidin A/B family lipoprotein n=1 Tax=Paracoccus onubensis TaxID=1675788 RepID=UPI00273224E1|nr:entericidin A/B family lipoprotein [Paracoccus onubensis]MDP0927577.1 entericidin A/B family lipoprotein [Paracoccus onubensis]
MQKKMLGVAVLLAVMAVSACETMQGAGRDLQTAGQVVQQESAEAQYGQTQY